MRRRAYLWCPAYGLADAARVAAALDAARAFCAALGFELVSSPRLARPTRPGAWPAPAEQAEDLAAALGHDLLLAARGGHGCVRLLDQVLSHGATPGMLVGYSDLTVLHAAWRRRGWGGTVYGFMPGVDHGPRALSSAVAAVRGEAVAIGPAEAPGAQVLRAGRAEGWCFAACLRVLAGLVGTPAMPDLRGAILALEDIDERPYQIDRDLTQLRLAGALAGVRGLVFGRLPAPLAADYGGPTAVEVGRRHAEESGVPAVFGLPIGHDPDPIALPIGRAVALECSGAEWGMAFAGGEDGGAIA